MAQSPLLGDTAEAPRRATGRDSDLLGPGDSSDSGSDLVGVEDLDTGDPAAPVDVGMRDEQPHPLTGAEAPAGGSDRGGTGERRSAASDGGREAADIDTDRIVDTLDGDDDDEDPDLAFMDAASPSPPGRPNPEPDPPLDPDDGEDPLPDDQDREERKPGRD